MKTRERKPVIPQIDRRYGEYEVIKMGRSKRIVRWRSGVADASILRAFEDKREARRWAMEQFIEDGGEIVDGREWVRS